MLRALQPQFLNEMELNDWKDLGLLKWAFSATFVPFCLL